MGQRGLGQRTERWLRVDGPGANALHCAESPIAHHHCTHQGAHAVLPAGCRLLADGRSLPLPAASAAAWVAGA